MGDAKDGFKKASAYSTVDPESIYIQEHPQGPFYDKRIELPIIPETVANIVKIGVTDPITVSSHEGIHYVVSGRQRVKHWREAIKVWKELGEPIKPLPVIIKQIKPDVGDFINVSCNEHRQNETPMGRIEKASALLATGHDEDSVANAFGISKQQLKNWLKADSLCASVKKLVDAGKISATAAIKFADLPAAEQKSEVEKLLESGVKPTVEKAVRAAKKQSPEKEGRKFSEKKVVEISNDPNTPEHCAALLKIVVGEWSIDAADGIEGLEWILPKK